MLKSLINDLYFNIKGIFILFIIVVLLMNDQILISRIKIFFIILLIIQFYLFILLLPSYFSSYFSDYFKNNSKKLENLIEILIKFYIIKNPVLNLIINLQLKLFFIFRKINYYLMNYYYLRLFVYLFIMNFFITPVTIIFYFYYKVWERWKNLGLVELFFKRVEGLLLSILFLTHAIDYFLDYFDKYIGLNIFNIFLMVYILLVILSFIKSYLGHKKIFDLDLKIILGIVIDLRMEVTILGQVLIRLLNIFQELNKNVELDLKGIFSIGYSPFLSYENIRMDYINRLLLAVEFKETMMKEIKYKPSYCFYSYLYINLELEEFVKSQYGYIINIEKRKDFEDILNYYKIYLKEVLFEIWRIEDYTNKNNNHKFFFINEVLGELFNTIDFDESVLLPENFKIEGNLEKFLDLEDNYEYYYKFFRKLKSFNILEAEELKKQIQSYEDLDVDHENSEVFEIVRQESMKFIDDCWKEWNNKKSK